MQAMKAEIFKRGGLPLSDVVNVGTELKTKVPS